VEADLPHREPVEALPFGMVAANGLGELETNVAGPSAAILTRTRAGDRLKRRTDGIRFDKLLIEMDSAPQANGISL